VANDTCGHINITLVCSRGFKKEKKNYFWRFEREGFWKDNVESKFAILVGTLGLCMRRIC
jgi:hypothetical protein